MFTLEAIKTAHSKVKSGADFPTYIQELKTLGLNSYTVFVEDGRSIYRGTTDFQLESEAKYPAFEISNELKKEQFQSDLSAHQQGKTDYLQFCQDCADSGIEKWVVSLEKMTCTYFSVDEEMVLEEVIPG